MQNVMFQKEEMKQSVRINNLRKNDHENINRYSITPNADGSRCTDLSRHERGRYAEDTGNTVLYGKSGSGKIEIAREASKPV
jgi:hypothetical protein